MPDNSASPTTLARDAIAAEVRAEMARQQKSAPDIAAVLGMTRQSVYNRLNGDVPFHGEELILIAADLGVPVEQFMRIPAAAVATEAGAA